MCAWLQTVMTDHLLQRPSACRAAIECRARFARGVPGIRLAFGGAARCAALISVADDLGDDGGASARATRPPRSEAMRPTDARAKSMALRFKFHQGRTALSSLTAAQPPRYLTRVRLGFSMRAWRLTIVPRLSAGPERLTPHP